jgi:hypothetical protein
MGRVRLSVSVLVVLALVIALIGCSKPPEAEQKAAKTAMDGAISAGADKYAVAEMEAAKKIWNNAESQVKEKKYKEAKQSYIDAKAAFEKASAAIEAGKKAVADQASASLTALGGAWKKLEATARKEARKLGDKKTAWEADAKSITEGLVKAKETIAKDAAEAKAKLDEVKGMIDKWSDAFKELAAKKKK